MTFRNTDMSRDALPCNVILCYRDTIKELKATKSLWEEGTLLKGVNGLLKMSRVCYLRVVQIVVWGERN